MQTCDGNSRAAVPECNAARLQEDITRSDLLDTLPSRFEHTPNILYSHFAHYDFDDVRQAEGKRQTAMLRQLADLLDKTGKELFYYFTVPHLSKSIPPPKDGSTVMSLAGDIWRFSPGPMKNQWIFESQAVKKQLGDGDLDGLVILQLSSLAPEVLRLHAISEDAIQNGDSRRESKGLEP